MEKLTPASKFLIAAIVLGSGATAFRTYGARMKSAPPPDIPARAAAPVVVNRPIRVAISQWPGHMALVVGAGGLKTQPASPAAAENLDLEIVFLEDAATKNKALQTGEIDFVWQTVDELPISMGGYRAAKVDVRAFLQIDWSRGGDACVASQEVQKVEDIAGRKAAMLMFSPDHTVFEFMITNSRLTLEQVADARKAALFSMDDFTYGRTLFTERKVDVACLWEPDVTLALDGRAGSHRLFSTADATELVADVLLARKEFLDTRPDIADKLARVWLAAVELAERDRPAAARLISTVASRFRDEMGYEKTLEALAWAKWTDLGDNVRMFGVDGALPAFDRVYNQADSIWINYPQADIKDRFAPAVLRDDGVVRRIWQARGRPLFARPEVYERRAAQVGRPVFTKPVSINFPVNKSELSVEALATINQHILPPLETARGMSIRVEGNTDTVGDKWFNQHLSELRAQAIIDYLVGRGIPPNRMVAKGNGATNPLTTNTTAEGRAKNRRTDVLFIRGPAGTP
ncbi:MAG TPA: phosphate ABC transporter substrate-binding/OmpA family protein [Polyangiaceae bacterium]|nr:phosphate ABC transporter substrate-binding/OmpA family protein [Polyangiaceae bacterium]